MDSHREWARTNLRGAESILLPAFTPDFSALDEEGIRLDVDNSVRHGFYSCYGSRSGLTTEEAARMLEVMVDQAAGRVLISGSTTGASVDEDVAFARRCADLGCSYLFVANPRVGAAGSDKVLAWYRSVIEATDLPVMLYAQLDIDRRLDIFDALADLPNAVAVKLTQPMSAATAFVVCERVADRLLVGPVHLELFPLLARHYGAQFTGPWNVESMQSPDRPYVVDFVDACAGGDFDRAMRVFRDLEPALRAFFALQAPIIERGGHPYAHMKFFQWCTGGNGGLPRDVGLSRDRLPALTTEARAAIRATYSQVGIEVVGDEETFAVGRAGFARGVRTGDLAPNRLYVPALEPQPLG